jgi:hypothetical protein
MKKKKVKFGTIQVKWEAGLTKEVGFSVYEIMILNEFEKNCRILYGDVLNDDLVTNKDYLVEKSRIKNIHEEELSSFKYWWYKTFKYN